MTQALYLLRLPAKEGSLAALGQYVAQGVPVELLVRASELGYHKELRSFSGDAAALRAYCEWVVRLAPLYQQLGRKLVLSPKITSRFAALREPNLSFLLHVLVGHHRVSQYRRRASSKSSCCWMPPWGSASAPRSGRPSSASYLRRGQAVPVVPVFLSLPVGYKTMRCSTAMSTCAPSPARK